MTTSRQVLRRTALKLLRDPPFIGTATGGSASTIVDTSGNSPLLSADDFWNKRYAYIFEGANIDELRQITDYDNATKILTVTHLFPAAIDTTSGYEITERWEGNLINEMIDNVIDRVAHRIQEYDNATVTTSQGTYEYSFTGMEDPFRVEIEVDTVNPTYPYMEIFRWRLTDKDGTRKIQFLDQDEMIVGRTLRCWFTKNPAALSADSSTSNIAKNIILDGIRAEAYMSALDDQGDNDAFRRVHTQAQHWEKKFQRSLQEFSRYVPARPALTMKWNIQSLKEKREQRDLRLAGG